MQKVSKERKDRIALNGKKKERRLTGEEKMGRSLLVKGEGNGGNV